jgi:hypothetical protein
LLFLISVVTYIDRVNISVTARQMMPAYGMTDQEMGWVFSAFVIGYALFQIPGMMGKRKGKCRESFLMAWSDEMLMNSALRGVAVNSSDTHCFICPASRSTSNCNSEAEPQRVQQCIKALELRIPTFRQHFVEAFAVKF